MTTATTAYVTGQIAAHVAKYHAPVPQPPVPPPVVPVPAGTPVPPPGVDLQGFLDAQPAGSTVVFPKGAIYPTTGIRGGKLTYVFSGAQLRVSGFAHSGMDFAGVDGFHLVNPWIVGDNPDAGGPNAYHSGGQEYSHGISLRGAKNGTIDDPLVEGVWGDGIFLGSYGTYSGWCDTIAVNRPIIRRNGRQGITINAARHVRINAPVMDALAMHAFDIEPDDPAEGVDDVVIADYQVGTYGLGSTYVPFLFVVTGNVGASVSNVSLLRGTVAGNDSGYQGQALGLNCSVFAATTRRKAITIDTAACNRPADGSKWPGAVETYASIDGLARRNITQPVIPGGKAFSISPDCVVVP